MEGSGSAETRGVLSGRLTEARHLRAAGHGAAAASLAAGGGSALAATTGRTGPDDACTISAGLCLESHSLSAVDIVRETKGLSSLNSMSMRLLV